MRTADPSIIHRDRARPLCCLLPVRPHLLDRYGRAGAVSARGRAAGDGRPRTACGRGRRASRPFPPSRAGAGPPRPLQVAPQLCPRPVSSAYAPAQRLPPSLPMAPKPGPVHARGAVPIPNPNPAQRCAGSPPGPHGRRSRMHWSPSRESRCRQWASAPQVLPVEAAARYLPLFIFLSRQRSTTSGRVSVAARLDARIDAPTSPARPAARVQCQASECSRDHQYMFGFCHCGHPPMTPLVARTT